MSLSPSIDDARATQGDLFSSADAPVLVAWGAGVDSTSMIIEMVARGERIDQVLFADVGAEKPSTYAYVELFGQWMRDRGIAFEIVRYEPQNFKNFPAYRTLDENVLTNATLPSVSFGFGSCSVKWKASPQNKWAERWAPAQRIWAQGGKVIKVIGYDAGLKDSVRYAEREGYVDAKYAFRYPLREWGWDRAACEARIAAEGLPVPPKSACYMCAATKPHELHELPVELLRRIVLMEARARPRLRNVDGLWRKPVKGLRGATPRPGSMTEYIRDKGLLPVEDIAEIEAAAPTDLAAFQDLAGGVAIDTRPELASWLRLFDLKRSGHFDTGPLKLYQLPPAA